MLLHFYNRDEYDRICKRCYTPVVFVLSVLLLSISQI